eukprot:CAMPEP_0116913142 /NCGR_PEP_ID=MMETSP0467-20121206/16522_1 /TAXON_ID=283647 /ORGANISM="Mesodinium pulex, Strain SPMC105" /LENGTH=43 /DNA_ID= /DNA_START= /DNA_END= /DNA_ORIENTATION=
MIDKDSDGYINQNEGYEFNQTMAPNKSEDEIVKDAKDFIARAV